MMKTSDAHPDTPMIDAFRARLCGDLLKPGDSGYDGARRVWNGKIDKHPALIARCATVSDVTHAVGVAREHGLTVAVRSGGHSIAGHGVCEGGLVIDVSPMKAIQVNAKARKARAQAGVTSGEFLRATQQFGLATPACPRSDVGLSGLTLGGGLGWLSAKYGLTCDNLLSVELVTAEGKLLKADAAEHSDLFWALRGGGGNFGVVTALEFRLHQVHKLVSGLALHPLMRSHEVLAFYREYTRCCPDELTVDAAFVSAPDGNPVVA